MNGTQTGDQKVSGVHVEFFAEPKEHTRLSRETGRPVFKDVEYVRIRFPGDMKRELVAPALSNCGRHPETNMPLTYAERYPDHYRAFRENDPDLVAGTPLTELSFLSSARRAELRALRVNSVEELAGLDERNYKAVGMDAREISGKARQWLEHVRSQSSDLRLAEENEVLHQKIAAMQEALVKAGIQVEEPAGNSTSAEASTDPGAMTAKERIEQGLNVLREMEPADIRAWLGDNGINVPPNTGKDTMLDRAEKILTERENDAE